MTKEKLKQYNVVLIDFDWFLCEIENELIDALYDSKLLDDKEFHNPDTKKTIAYFLIKKITQRLFSQSEKCVFLVKPEMAHTSSEILKHFNNYKLRRLFLTLFRFLVKNRFNVFVFLNKSYSDEENSGLLDIPEIRDFIDIHVQKTTKKLSIDNDTVHKLFEKLCKKLK